MIRVACPHQFRSCTVCHAWANGNALINGHDDGTLEPGGTTTRAQAASILMRFDQKLVEN